MLKELDGRILALCVDGDIGLSVLVSRIGEYSREDDKYALRGKALAVLERLLKDGLVRAGRPTPDGKAFVTWDLAADQSLERIKREWDNLSREPAAGDIAWFAATKEGVRVAAAR